LTARQTHLQRFEAESNGINPLAHRSTVISGTVPGLQAVLLTLTSVGAGALCAVLLTCLVPLRMTPSHLAATDRVHALRLTALAGSGRLLMGNVDGSLLLQLAAGSIPGVLLGAHHGDRATEAVPRPLIALVLVAVGVKLILT
jgi:uncharacterized protein